MGLSRMFVVTAAGAAEGTALPERIAQVLTIAITPLTLIPFLILTAAALRPEAKEQPARPS